MVSAIVPVYNEAERIGNVLRVLASTPLIDEIIVVDDGSTDATVKVAKKCSDKIQIFKLRRNQGKTTAMLRGADVAKGNILCFIDADLVGLCIEDVETLIRPIRDKKADMTICYRTSANWAIRYLIPWEPILGGERCLKKEDCVRILSTSSIGAWDFEILSNTYFLTAKRRIAITKTKELNNTLKVRKRGVVYGAINDVKIHIRFWRRFGIYTFLRQFWKISYRFHWLQLTQGWKDGYVVL